MAGQDSAESVIKIDKSRFMGKEGRIDTETRIAYIS